MLIRGLLAVAIVAAVGAALVPSAPPADAKGKWGKKLKIAGHAGDMDAVREILGKIASAGDADGAEDILKAVPYMSAEEVLDEILDTFKVLGVDKIDPIFKKHLEKYRDKEPIGSTCIFRLAETLSDSTSEGWILLGIPSVNSITVRNALAAAEKRKLKSAIPRLIDQLEELNPKRYRLIIFEIEDTLYELTREEFDSVEDWRSWWEINEESFDPTTVGKGDEGKATGVRKKKRTDDSPEFFGVEVLSSKVMFVVDTSGSMQLWDPAKGEGGGSANWRKRQRIERVKEQLTRALSELKKSSKFNVIGFSDRLKKFNTKGGIVPASGKQKKKAVKWVSGLNARGATHTDDALKEAFKDKEIDTIMLLSDGAPTRQNGPPSNEIISKILRDVEKWNKIRKVKIFTFGFEGAGKFPPNSGQQGQPGTNPAFGEFLRKLANDNDGSYISID